MSCYYRGTGGCSQVCPPCCNVFDNGCQFCGPRSEAASCANWNGQLLFGNSCCAKSLRLATESTLTKRKSFSKRVAEEEAKDQEHLKSKKKNKGRKNGQDLEIMFKALENYCDPKKQDCTKVDKNKSATTLKESSSKTSRNLPCELAKTKKLQNQEEKNKVDAKKFPCTAEMMRKCANLGNASERTKPGRYENQLTIKANENKMASKASVNKEATKATPQLKPKPENVEATEATKADTERKQFNELEICNILTDLLVKKFKAIDYTSKMLGDKKYTPKTSPCCSKCTCDVCSCLGSTDFTEVESKIGTATGALISDNLKKVKNVAQKNNDTKKSRTLKEALPSGLSPMSAINTRRGKERLEQKMLIDATTSMTNTKNNVITKSLLESQKLPKHSPIDNLLNELKEIEEEDSKSSKGYYSELDKSSTDSDPSSKKNKKLKGRKKLRSKDGATRGSLAAKRSSTTSKISEKKKVSSNSAHRVLGDNGQYITSPVEISNGSRFKEGCNINTCTSKECPAKKLSKSMIEVLTYASNLSVAKSNRSPRAESPTRVSKASVAPELLARKSTNRSSQTPSVIDSLQLGYDSRSPSRGSTSTSVLEEYESQAQKTKNRTPIQVAPVKSTDKKLSKSFPDIRASASTSGKKQSITADKKQSVSSPNSRKASPSPDNKPSFTAPENIKSNTPESKPSPISSPRKASASPAITADKKQSISTPNSRKTSPTPDNKPSITAPDNRKPYTSDRKQTPESKSSPFRTPITTPDKKQTITSPDKKKSTTTPDKPSSNAHIKEGCTISYCTSKENNAKSKNRPLGAESSAIAAKESRAKDLPVRKCARSAQTEPINETLQRVCDYSSGSSPTSENEENASTIAGASTRSPQNKSAVRSADKSSSPRSPDKASPIKATDKITALKAPDTKPSTYRSSVKKQTNTAPDNRQTIKSTINQSIKSAGKRQSLKSADKNQSIKSTDRRPSISPPDKITTSPSRREGCNISTCTSTECAAKKLSHRETSAKEQTSKDSPIRKSARSTQTVSPDESSQKYSNSRRTSPSLSPVETSTRSCLKKRSAVENETVSCSDKKIVISSTDRTASARAHDKKPYNTSAENSNAISSPKTLSSSPRLRADLSAHTNASSAKNGIVTKCSCECRTSSRSKTVVEELKNSSPRETDSSNVSRGSTSSSSAPEMGEKLLTKADFNEYVPSAPSQKSKTKPICKSWSEHESSIRTEDTRRTNFSENIRCECDDSNQTDESSMPLDELPPPAKLTLNENSSVAGNKLTRTICKSWSESDINMREEELRMPSSVVNERCVCDMYRTDDTITCASDNPQCLCSRLPNEEDPMKVTVFDRCLCSTYPTNYHPCHTVGNRCPCNDVQKGVNNSRSGGSRNTTRAASDRSQTENKSAACASRKKSPSPTNHSPAANEAYTYSSPNNASCQCSYQAPNSREIPPPGSKPNFYAFNNTETEETNSSDDNNAKIMDTAKQSSEPAGCTYPNQRDDKRAECNQALTAFRRLQECFSDFDLEGECFKKLENYAEFHSDIFGPCACDQSEEKIKSADKKRNPETLKPNGKENKQPEMKNKQNKGKKRSK